MKKYKTLGIIGGLGPETTAHFYLKVVFTCSKISGKRPKILISNVAVPLKIEEKLITEEKNIRGILPFVIDSAIQLEKGGADFIVIPCNTVHVFINEIRDSVNIPILSIIEETSKFLVGRKIKKVGLLGTSTTIHGKLFDKNLKDCGINIKISDNLNQQKIGIIINRLVNNNHNNKDRLGLLKIINDLNVNNVVLACTDLQILKPECKGIKIFDTMDILAKASVREQFK